MICPPLFKPRIRPWVLAGLPQATVAQLQRIHNSAARFRFELNTREHSLSRTVALAWMASSALACPAYLTDIVESIGACRTHSGLQSTSSTDFTLPRLRTKLGERAFSHAGPSTWNALPEHLRAVTDPEEFRQQLKTHFYVSVFSKQATFNQYEHRTWTYSLDIKGM